MTSHKDYRLDQLGIISQYEADELERDLNVRFDRFTYNDREVWVQQNAYLDAYAHNGAVSDSADMAGVPVSIAQNWEYHNTLGFKRRLEIADLRFSDGLQILALERVREPNAPAALLIELLRAHIPEKFSSNGHVCDTSKADELLSRYSENANRELEAGHPTLRAIANGTYQPRSRLRSHDDPSYTGTPSADAASDPAHDPSAPSASTRHSRERGNPQDLSPHAIESDQDASSSHEAPFPLPDDDIEPVDPDEVAFFNLPPSEREDGSHPNLSPTDTPSVGAGFKPAHDASAPSTSPAVNSPLPSVRPEPVEGQSPSPTRHSRARGNPQDVSPNSIESDHDTSSSHEAPFPLPDDDIEPVDPDEVAFFNLPPEERKTTPNPSASSAPSAVNPPAPKRPSRPFATLFQKTRPNPNDNHDTFPIKRF